MLFLNVHQFDFPEGLRSLSVNYIYLNGTLKNLTHSS